RTLIFAGVAEAVGDAGATGRRGTVRRACVATRGCAATDQRWARAYSSARRQPTGASGAQGLCDILALAAGRVVRATTRARRCGQAVAGAVFRRSPSAFQRYAESTAGAAGAGRTVDSLQGRRGVLRHPVASRSAGPGAGPTGAAHPAWTAGFHGEGAKGVACSGRGLSSEPRVLHARHPCRSGNWRGAGGRSGGEGHPGHGAAGGHSATAVAGRSVERVGTSRPDRRIAVARTL